MIRTHDRHDKEVDAAAEATKKKDEGEASPLRLA